MTKKYPRNNNETDEDWFQKVWIESGKSIGIKRKKYAGGGGVSSSELQKRMNDHKEYCLGLYPYGKMTLENGFYGVRFNDKLRETIYIGQEYFEIDGTIYKENTKNNVAKETKLKLETGGTTQNMFSEMPDAGLYEMLNILIKESGSDKEKNKEAISDITAEIKRRQSPKFAPGGKTDPEFRYNYEVVLSKIDKDGNWHEFERKAFGDDYSSVLIYANKMNKEGIGVDVYENGHERGWSTNNGMHYFDKGGSVKPYKILANENPKPLIVNDNQVSMFETIEKPVKLHPRTKQPMSNSVPEVDIVIKRTIPFNERPKVTNSKSATEIFRKFWDTDRINVQESFWIMLLDRANNVIGIYNPSKGGIAATIVDGGLIGATALKSLAQAVIVCHNHPSGNLKFSQSDKIMTKKLGTTLKVLDIALLDSMVITETEYNSMADNSELPDFD